MQLLLLRNDIHPLLFLSDQTCRRNSRNCNAFTAWPIAELLRRSSFRSIYRLPIYSSHNNARMLRLQRRLQSHFCVPDSRPTEWAGDTFFLFFSTVIYYYPVKYLLKIHGNFYSQKKKSFWSALLLWQLIHSSLLGFLFKDIKQN